MYSHILSVCCLSIYILLLSIYCKEEEKGADVNDDDETEVDKKGEK